MILIAAVGIALNHDAAVGIALNDDAAVGIALNHDAAVGIALNHDAAVGIALNHDAGTQRMQKHEQTVPAPRANHTADRVACSRTPRSSGGSFRSCPCVMFASMHGV